MRITWLAIPLLWLCLGCTPQPAGTAPVGTLDAGIKPYYPVVTAGNGIIKFYMWYNVSEIDGFIAKQQRDYATGFFIQHRKGTYLVTARHAVPEKGWEWSLQTYRMGEFVSDPAYDVAVIRVYDRVPTLDWVSPKYTLTGYPADSTTECTLSGARNSITADIPAALGMSGSPLLADGKVVGVLSAIYDGQPGCLCVPIGRAIDLIERD